MNLSPETQHLPESAHDLPQSTRLTPRDIRHQAFPGRVGGYDRAAVQTFLSLVAEQFEEALRVQKAQHERLTELERRVAEYERAEDEIRRTVVAAEWIGHDLRHTTERECELLLAQAKAERDNLLRDARARALELSAEHRTRQAEQDRAHAERLAALDRAYQEQAADCAARLSAARHEYAQFLSSYRALLASFSDLASGHRLLDLSAFPPPSTPPLAAHSPDRTNLALLESLQWEAEERREGAPDTSRAEAN